MYLHSHSKLNTPQTFGPVGGLHGNINLSSVLIFVVNVNVKKIKKKNKQ